MSFRNRIKQIVLSLLIILISLPRLVISSEPFAHQQWHHGDLPHTLVLAMDGVPYGVVESMYWEGFFRGFFPPAKMVSTFPSMTDVAFTEMFGMGPTKGYQQVYFSHAKNRLVGNLGSEMFQLEEFEKHFDSIVHSTVHLLTLYVTTYSAAKSEWDTLEKKFWQSRNTPVFYGYIAGSDAIAHRHGLKGLIKYLKAMDGYIEKLQREYQRKSGHELTVIMLSDHGNTLLKGKLINANRELRKNGFNPDNSISNDASVVSTVAGVVGYWALYMKVSLAPDLADKLIDMEGADLVMYRHDDGRSIVVTSQKGKAIITYDEANHLGRYQLINGDPLNYLDLLPSGEGFLEQQEIFDRTLHSKYPNGVYRIHRCFYGAVKNPASIVVSLKPGYEFSSKIIKTVALVGKRWGTHGSLHAADSLGVYMRTDRAAADVSAAQLADHLELHHFNLPEKVARVRVRGNQ